MPFEIIHSSLWLWNQGNGQFMPFVSVYLKYMLSLLLYLTFLNENKKAIYIIYIEIHIRSYMLEDFSSSPVSSTLLPKPSSKG